MRQSFAIVAVVAATLACAATLCAADAPRPPAPAPATTSTIIALPAAVKPIELATLFDAATRDMHVVMDLHGFVMSDAPARQVLVAHVAADGTLVTSCVTSEETMLAFFAAAQREETPVVQTQDR